jgi:hypothetical protein
MQTRTRLEQLNEDDFHTFIAFTSPPLWHNHLQAILSLMTMLVARYKLVSTTL